MEDFQLGMNFQPGWPGWNLRTITWEISTRAVISCLNFTSKRTLVSKFQPGLKFLVDYMENFSPINWAENLIPYNSNRAEIFGTAARTEFFHQIANVIY